jgi:hypothetical protein
MAARKAGGSSVRPPPKTARTSGASRTTTSTRSPKSARAAGASTGARRTAAQAASASRASASAAVAAAAPPPAFTVPRAAFSSAELTKVLKSNIGLLANAIGVITHTAAKFDTLPPRLLGTLLQPGGAAGAGLLVAAHITTDVDGTTLDPAPSGVSDPSGFFDIPLPGGMSVPDGNITLSVWDGTPHLTNVPSRIDLALPLADVGDNGVLGALELPRATVALPPAMLGALAPVSSNGTGSGAQQLTVRLGDDQDCVKVFENSTTVDQFRYGVFVRMVPPELFWDRGSRGNVQGQGAAFTRIPLAAPVPVDSFVAAEGRMLPLAGTLGLGYIVQMAQQWTQLGLGLGNLVYSLPLAPGEQQKVAIFDRTQSVQQVETQSVSFTQLEDASQASDASTQATFQSAFREMAESQSHMSTLATSAAANFGGGLLSVIGLGSTSVGASGTSGSSSSSMQGVQNYVSNAAQQLQSTAEQHSALRRRLLSTSMRSATESESDQVTTKVITNHNKTRALTLQYWEVLRLYEVATDVEGVTLVALVPLDLIPFLPSGQATTLFDPAQLPDRSSVLNRYTTLLRYADVLAQWLPDRYRSGLVYLDQFAADPRAQPLPPNASTAEDVIDVSVTGNFLPFDQVQVAAVTRWGGRIGPLPLSFLNAPTFSGTYTSADQLKNALASARELELATSIFGGSPPTAKASIALPQTVTPSDVVGFEITSSMTSFSYPITPPVVKTYTDLFGAALGWPPSVLGALTDAVHAEQANSQTVALVPGTLAQVVGTPTVTDFTANLAGSGVSYIDASFSAARLPGGSPLSVPALEIPPVLKFEALLEIERTLQHVIRSEVTYSKIVWLSLTAEERAIMLELYSIDVNGQAIPLLDCVANQVHGFFGNSMIMPFFVPAPIAAELKVGTATVQNVLAQFHQSGLDVGKSVMALPTPGVLGEAVLGHCASAERIDLTRFWNWQDSPADTAPGIADVTVPTAGALSLSAMPALPNRAGSLVANINNGPGSGAVPAGSTAFDVLSALIKGAPNQALPNLDTSSKLADLLNATLKTAEQARADALDQSSKLTETALQQAGSVLSAAVGGGGGGGSKGGAKAGKSGGGSSQGSGSGDTSAGNASGGNGSSDGGGSGISASDVISVLGLLALL